MTKFDYDVNVYQRGEDDWWVGVYEWVDEELVDNQLYFPLTMDEVMYMNPSGDDDWFGSIDNFAYTFKMSEGSGIMKTLRKLPVYKEEVLF